MIPQLSEMLAFLTLGLVSSAIGSTLGLGGGAIAVPLSLAFLKFPPYYIVSASLTMVVTTSLISTLNYLKLGYTDVVLGLTLETFTIPGAILGAELCSISSTKAFKLLLIAILLLTAIRVIMGKGRNISKEEEESSKGIQRIKGKVLPAAFLSFLAGFLSGYLGIGGGVLKVPLMILLGIPTKIAVGTSAFMVGITGLSGLITYMVNGLWNWRIALPLVIGALIGANIGPQITKRVPERYLRYSFGILLLLIAIKLI